MPVEPEHDRYHDDDDLCDETGLVWWTPNRCEVIAPRVRIVSPAPQMVYRGTTGRPCGDSHHTCQGRNV